MPDIELETPVYDITLSSDGIQGGASSHPELSDRDLPNQHPASAIEVEGEPLDEYLANLVTEAGGKATTTYVDEGDASTLASAEDLIQALTAEDVGADPAGTAADAVADLLLSVQAADDALGAEIEGKENVGVAAALVAAEAALARDAGNLSSGTVNDARLPATIARDSEVTALVGAEAAARDTAITAAINALKSTAPGLLDTLAELATALGNDPNFASTLTTALAGKQPLDGDLTALASVVSAANKLPYFTGAGAAAVTDFTPLARQLLDDLDNTAMRTTLGAEAAGTAAFLFSLIPTLLLTGGLVATTAAGVTTIRMGDVGTGTIKGRVAAGTGAPSDLTPAQVRTLLDVPTTGDLAAEATARALGDVGGNAVVFNNGAATFGASTNTEGSVMTTPLVLPAGTLAADGDTMVLTWGGDIVQNSGAANAWNAYVKMNGTNIHTSAIAAQGTSAFAPVYTEEVTITRVSATQLLVRSQMVLTNSLNTAISYNNTIMPAAPLAVPDLAANALTFDLTMKWGTANALSYFRPYYFTARLGR